MTDILLPLDRPLLRPVEPIPVGEGPDAFVLVRDPEELAGDSLGVGIAMALVMTLCDGTRTLDAIARDLGAMIGQTVDVADVAAMVKELDAHWLLDNDRSRARLLEVRNEFERQPFRDPAHAGTAYPADPAELAATLDAFYAHPEGPARGGARREKAPRGLIVPHIDPREGGPCMARAFDELRVAEPPELYIVLGVAHQYAPNLYTMTEKDFRTPLGPARTKREATRRLRELYGGGRLAGEWAHKREHSVEFPAVFLSHLHRDGPDFAILPILCGSIHEEMAEGRGARPIERPDVREFVEALRKLMDEFGPRVCLIASVDLSHVGLKFGDERGVDDFRADLIRAADLRMLETVRERDAEAFYDHFRPDRNARNVDAVCAVYTMLHALGPGEARLLGYDQYREAPTQSLVSYASMALD